MAKSAEMKIAATKARTMQPKFSARDTWSTSVHKSNVIRLQHRGSVVSKQHCHFAGAAISEDVTLLAPHLK